MRMTAFYSCCMWFCCLVLSMDARSQHTEPALLKLIYSFSHRYDKSPGVVPVEAEMSLRVGSTNARYGCAAYEMPVHKPFGSGADGPPPEVVAAAETGRAFVGMPGTLVTSKKVSFEVLYLVPDKKQLVSFRLLGFQNFKTELPYPEIDWTIEQETKQIDRFVCQKATGAFGGRVYTAWFAPDLPFAYGPWKLCGLPGLILEAEDADREVVFKFKSLEMPTEEYVMVEVNRVAAVSEKEFDRAKLRHDKDPIAYSAAYSIAQFGTEPAMILFLDVSGSMVSDEAAKQAIKKEIELKITNPMELK